MGVIRVECQGVFYKAIMKCVRLIPSFRYNTSDTFVEPAVYICRHGNMRGPVLSVINLPLTIHPWVFHVFCEKKACYKHYSEYTFSVRFGWKKWSANLISRIISPSVVRLVNSVGAIPVYRNSARVMSTFRMSMDALSKGESLLIFPEVDYTAEGGEIGELYEGFLGLEKMYLKKTGKHLPFVPIHLSEKRREIILGEPVLFRDGVTFAEGRDEVIQKIQTALNELGEGSLSEKGDNYAAF